MITSRSRGVRRIWLTLAATVLIGVAVLALVGWQFDLSPLKRLFVGLTPMNPLTALCFIALGANLAVRTWRPHRIALADCFAGAVVIVTSCRLGAYLFGADFPLDKLLYSSELLREQIHNEMAWSTATLFLLCGIGYLATSIREAWASLVAQAGAAITAFTALLVTDEYVFRALSNQDRMIPMALNTALMFLVASGGILILTWRHGFMRTLTLSAAGSKTTLLLLGMAIVIPFGLGLTIEELRRNGFIGQRSGDAFTVALISGVFAVVIWMTARCNARAEEAVLAAKADAERANLAKSEFLSRMSHELRTPLNAILGFAQILQLEGLSDRQADCVSHILRGGKHLLSMINEVLDISRIETGNLAMSCEPVEASGLLREAVQLLAPVASDKGVDLRDRTDSSDQIYVTADRQRLHQVLINLLSNAIKYNVADGKVTVECRHGEPGRVQLVVSDTGKGIDEDKLSQLFSPFSRLGAEDSTVEGTGLGLALSKSLSECMGGTLVYAPNPGGGSVFTLELRAAANPISANEPALRQLANQQVSFTNGLRVLVVEDNASNIALLKRIFEARPSVDTKIVTRGSSAVSTAVEYEPDLILLDVNLPDVSGDEVLRHLKSSPQTSEIPVVVTSADASSKTIAGLLSLGATEYLTKPLDVSKLLEVVDGRTMELKRSA